MELEVLCCFIKILSQITLTLNCYSAVVSSWRHLISLLRKWKTQSSPVMMTQHIREEAPFSETPFSEALFSEDLCCVETSTLIWLTSRWAGLYMVQFFNTGRYFQRDHQALVCESFLVSLPSSMLNLFWTWRWSGYRGVFEYWGVFGMFSLFPY